MKISDFKITQDGDDIKASALVQFEECDKGEKEIFIKTPKKYENSFKANPHTFLVGALLPAIHLKEKRVFIDEKICPLLKESLNVAMKILQHWTKGKYQPLKIEALTSSVVKPLRKPRTGMFMSGGLDSLAALRLNRLN